MLQANNDLSKCAAVEVLVGGRRILEIVDRVDHGMDLPLLKTSKHLLERGSRTDGDPA